MLDVFMVRLLYYYYVTKCDWTDNKTGKYDCNPLGSTLGLPLGKPNVLRSYTDKGIGIEKHCIDWFIFNLLKIRK